MTMTAEGIGVGIAALAAIAATVKYVVQSELAAHEIKIQTWINGSFMRAAVVTARMDAQDARINELAGR